MKIGPGMFWGILLIIIGLSLVLKVVFNVDFPLIKIVVAFFFIYLGIRILFGNMGIFRFKAGDNDVIFGESKIYGREIKDDEYNVIFAKGVFDLRDINLEDGNVHVKINTIFGHSVILVNANTPLEVKADAVFSGAQLPGGNASVFGSSHYISPDLDFNQPHLKLKIDVVFGGVDIKTY